MFPIYIKCWKKKENKIIIINCSGNCAIFALLFDSGLYKRFWIWYRYETGKKNDRKIINNIVLFYNSIINKLLSKSFKPQRYIKLLLSDSLGNCRSSVISFQNLSVILTSPSFSLSTKVSLVIALNKTEFFPILFVWSRFSAPLLLQGIYHCITC